MQQFSLVPENQVKRLKRLRPRLQLCFFIKHSAKFNLDQRSQGEGDIFRSNYFFTQSNDLCQSKTRQFTYLHDLLRARCCAWKTSASPPPLPIHRTLDQLLLGSKKSGEEGQWLVLTKRKTSNIQNWDSCRCSKKLSMVEGRFSKWF